MDYSFSEHINFNAFPFKLRFSTNNKLYHEIKNECDDLNNTLLKLNIEIRDKTIIANLLKEYFSYVGLVLRKALECLNANNEQNDQVLDAKRQLEGKLAHYYEDDHGSLFFGKMKETTVLINALPSNWKCLTWQKHSLPKIGIANNSHKLKQISNDGKVESSDLFNKELEDISSTLSLVNSQIHLMKNRIFLLNEFIVYLYSNYRDYLKFLLQFNLKLSDNNNFNETTMENLKIDLSKLFEIELKIDFFSNSANAYKMKTPNRTIHLELKSSIPVLVSPNSRGQANVPFIPNQDQKNITAVSYASELYMDHNVHFSANPPVQQ